MKNIIINSITETTYENNTSWVNYKINNKEGYQLINDLFEGAENIIHSLVNRNIQMNNIYAHKKCISICSSYLQDIINGCLQSENEMFFVEYDDLKNKISDEDDTFLDNLKQEVVDLNIQDVICFDEDGCAITVYGEVLTRFLF